MSFSGYTPTRAHPRSRGEHYFVSFLFGISGGSSPLARGTRAAYTAQDTQGGRIPARAGNTSLSCTVTFMMRAHPRSRGEHLGIDNTEFFVEGSSPLARGTRAAFTAQDPQGGLIPARAGNTSLSCTVTFMMRAHPRSRGEHLGIDNTEFFVEGSSPLARGTLGFLSNGCGCGGLIPARAGNTVYRMEHVSENGAHPRSRGEH